MIPLCINLVSGFVFFFFFCLVVVVKLYINANYVSFIRLVPNGFLLVKNMLHE